jgi:hypothetical protein
MMAYAIHSNVRNLGLFFIYDKVFQNGKERNISLVSSFKNENRLVALNFQEKSMRNYKVS